MNDNRDPLDELLLHIFMLILVSTLPILVVYLIITMW